MSQAQPPFISSINLPEQVAKNESFQLDLRGNWPNPSWSYSSTDIDTDVLNKHISISYLGISGGGLALQVLKPVGLSHHQRYQDGL